MSRTLHAIACFALVACTAAQLQGLSAALAAFGIAAPAACPIVAAVDGTAVGKVCSADVAAASALAAELSAIVATMPPISAPKAGSAQAGAAPIAYDAAGFHVELRADLCQPVQAAAKVRARQVMK